MALVLKTSDNKIVHPTKALIKPDFTLFFSRKGRTDNCSYKSCSLSWFIFKIGDEYYEADHLNPPLYASGQDSKVDRFYKGTFQVNGTECQYILNAKDGYIGSVNYTPASALAQCWTTTPSSYGICCYNMGDNAVGWFKIIGLPENCEVLVHNGITMTNISYCSPYLRVEYKNTIATLSNLKPDTPFPSATINNHLYVISPTSSKIGDMTLTEINKIKTEGTHWHGNVYSS